MKHLDVRRDPTIPLVLVVLVVVVLVVVLGTRHRGDDSSAPPVGPSITSTPSVAPSPTTTDSFTPTTSPRAPVTSKPPKPPKAPVNALRPKGPQVCVPQGTDTDITVVSYNIKSGRGGGTLPEIAAALQASGADVVMFQEIRSTPGGIDQPAYFANALGMSYQMGVNVFHGNIPYGTAILSKFPIVSAHNTLLPHPPHTQQRGLLHVVVDIGGSEVSLYDTHLENTSPDARVAQMRAIVSLVAPDPRPQIFAGDMNSPPSSAPSSIARTHFTDTWATVGVGTGFTHPAHHLRVRIDYLYNANTGVTPLTSDVLPAILSDHMALRATYEVAGPDTKVCVRMLAGTATGTGTR